MGGIWRNLSTSPLRLCRHIRRKIQPERQSIGITMDQPFEHFPASRSDFQDTHTIPDPRALQCAFMSLGMKEKRASRINSRNNVVYATGPSRDRLRQLVGL